MSAPVSEERPIVAELVRPAPAKPARPDGGILWLVKGLVRAGLFLGAGVLLLVALGVAQKRGWITAGPGGGAAATAAPGTEYTCPMHPQIRQPGPGRCPICAMELVPASAAASDMDEYAVHVTPAARRLARIETAEAKELPLTRTVRTVGVLTVDESRQATIAAYTDGRIERMFADYTGVKVNAGDHMVVLYSPQLYVAQAQYLESRRTLREMGAATLASVRESQRRVTEGARQRLIELGMTEEQVAELEKTDTPQTRLTIFAPIGGTVTRKNAVPGEYVKTGQPIYEIADLGTVWLVLKLFPEDASHLRFGQEVRAELQSLPGQELIGRVGFILPTVDPRTRTVDVRVELLNLDGKLRPGDYASATAEVPLTPAGEVFDAALAGKWISPMHPQVIRDEPGNCPICGMELVPTSRYGYAEKPLPPPTSLVVPREAVLKVGRHSVVYVETEPGRFEIRPVKLGPVTAEYASVVSGLKPGEQVATAGNFLIDSQMQLTGKPSLIDPTRALARNEGPLEIGHVHVEPLPGKTGERLEDLYRHYLEVQKLLAADAKPSEPHATGLHAAAQDLLKDEKFPENLRPLVKEVAAHAGHLHHMELAAAREAFKPISHAVIKLAAAARGAAATGTLTQFHCPMVKGGGGDWLQAAPPLRNPYWGAEMLECGSEVRTLPVKGHGEKE